MNEWKQVTKNNFYSSIGPINCHATLTEKWPFTSIFKTPLGVIVGKKVGYLKEAGNEKTKYFLPA